MTDRFEQALGTATAQLMSEFGEDLMGLLLAGSAAYGTPMGSSDLDLYVLIRPRWRQRRNEILEGVEVEMLINPVEQIRREFADGLDATVDMFARGRVCHDPSGVVRELVDQARQAASQPAAPPSESDLYFIRYHPSDLLRDAEDLLDVDVESAELVLGAALRSAIDARWRCRGLPVPKPKRALQALRDVDPEAARLAEQILQGALPRPQRVALLRRFCELMLEPVGGVMLEGRTPPEPVT